MAELATIGEQVAATSRTGDITQTCSEVPVFENVQFDHQTSIRQTILHGSALIGIWSLVVVAPTSRTPAPAPAYSAPRVAGDLS